MQISAQHTDCI